MMTIQILAFGISRDILGAAQTSMTLHAPLSIGEFRAQLITDYPPLAALTSLAIARNGEYASDQDLIQPQDELALIPPVSGG